MRQEASTARQPHPFSNDRRTDALAVSRKKKAGAKPTLKHWGLNRTRYNGPDPLEPRGAGGLRNPELFPDRVLSFKIAIHRGGRWTELGPYCGSLHEAVTAIACGVALTAAQSDSRQFYSLRMRLRSGADLAAARGSGNH